MWVCVGVFPGFGVNIEVESIDFQGEPKHVFFGLGCYFGLGVIVFCSCWSWLRVSLIM